MEALFPIEAVSLENGRGVEEADVQFREHARGLHSAARMRLRAVPRPFPPWGHGRCGALPPALSCLLLFPCTAPTCPRFKRTVSETHPPMLPSECVTRSPVHLLFWSLPHCWSFPVSLSTSPKSGELQDGIHCYSDIWVPTTSGTVTLATRAAATQSLQPSWRD